MLGTRLINFNQARTLCENSGKVVIPYAVWTELFNAGMTGSLSWEISDAPGSIPHFRKTQAYQPPDDIAADLRAFDTDMAVGVGFRGAKLVTQ